MSKDPLSYLKTALNEKAAIVEHSADTSIVYCNRLALKLLGLKKDDATGIVVADSSLVFHREDGTVLPLEEFPVVQVLNTKKALHHFVVGVMPPDSQELAWVLVDAYPRCDKEGAVKTVLVIYLDINGGEGRGKSMRESEVGLKESQRLAKLGSWSLDLASKEVKWSEELYAMYGFDPRLPPPVSTEIQKLFTPESWAKQSASIQNTLETGIPYEIELEFVPKGRSPEWMRARGEAVRNANGCLVGLRGIAQNITASKLAEKAVAARAAELVIADEEKSARAAELVIADEEKSARAAELVIADAEKSARSAELVIADAEKSARAAELVIADEELSSSTKTILELKEKQGLERKIQEAQRLESLGVLAGGIAHDFNNILTTILGNADLALDCLSPHSPARSSIQNIEFAARRAAELANQMLAYSGKGRFVVQAIHMGEFVKEMSRLLEVSISKKVTLDYNLADNLPTFNGDVTQIRQVLVNLIVNASEAIGNRRGIITISTGVMHCDHAYLEGIEPSGLVGLEEPLAEESYVYIEISDTGCGMDAATREKIFDPFFTTKFTGRGLGLSATLGIVRGHKGALKIYSEVGKGTTFKILFPVSGSGAPRAVLEHGDDALAEWQGEGTVLIVDDEETICAMGRQMVERMGFTALTAADGLEAVEVFREHRKEIVCVLLDLTMPRMDGEETFRELRRIQPEVQVILCSGYNSQAATQSFTGKGLAGFIQKPYRMALLKKTLAQLLGS